MSLDVICLKPEGARQMIRKSGDLLVIPALLLSLVLARQSQEPGHTHAVPEGVPVVLGLTV